MAEALVGVHVGREQQGEIRQRRLLAADEMTERGGRLALFVAEDVPAAALLHQALVNVHRAARGLRQRLGHAHHGDAVLERDFLEQVLEEEGLVGQQQRIAVQQVDLELADAHLVHEGVARQAERRHAAVDLLEERPQAVVGRHAERRVAVLATTVQAQRRLERLMRVGIGREDEEFQFGRHHRRHTALGIAGDDLLQQATGGQPGAATVQLVGIADRQGARRLAPGQAMDLRRIGNQRQIAVVAAVETRRRVAAHDALQQDPARQLQATAFEKASGGHHLAARHAVEVGGDALDFIDTGQSFGE